MFEPNKTSITDPYLLRACLAKYLMRLDQKISIQLSKVLSHPQFKTLEASWRSLAYLVEHNRSAAKIKICFLSINRTELANDLLHALEFDQSQLFDKVYNQGFGMAGGEPFNVLIGDYEFSHTPQDIQLLQALSQIAAAAFAPFISGASPKLLEINSFFELGRQPKLINLFHQQEYFAWQQMRKQEDMRFVALCLPHHLLRLPYQQQLKNGSFQYHDPHPETGYLWGHAAYAFVVVLMRNFIDYAWFGNIRGNAIGQGQGGCVPPAVQRNENQRLSPLFSVNALITDQQEKAFNDLGLIALCQSHDEGAAVFYNNTSIQQVTFHQDPTYYISAKAGSMLQYLLCACRFAHYLKIIARDKIGSFSTPEACEDGLNQWLLHYVAGNTDLGLEQRSKFPLQGGLVKVSEQPTMPGAYYCRMHLKPFFQLEQLQAEFIFVTLLGTALSKGGAR